MTDPIYLIQIVFNIISVMSRLPVYLSIFGVYFYQYSTSIAYGYLSYISIIKRAVCLAELLYVFFKVKSKGYELK